MLAGLVLVRATPGGAGESQGGLLLDYGSLSQLPADAKNPVDVKAPTSGMLTAQYGFGFDREFIPYLGTGLSYNIHPDIRPGDPVKIKAGLAGQAGFKYLLGENLMLKFDYKILTVTPDSSRDSSTPSQSLGMGVHIKF